MAPSGVSLLVPFASALFSDTRFGFQNKHTPTLEGGEGGRGDGMKCPSDHLLSSCSNLSFKIDFEMLSWLHHPPPTTHSSMPNWSDSTPIPAIPLGPAIAPPPSAISNPRFPTASGVSFQSIIRIPMASIRKTVSLPLCLSWTTWKRTRNCFTRSISADWPSEACATLSNLLQRFPLPPPTPPYTCFCHNDKYRARRQIDTQCIVTTTKNNEKNARGKQNKK